MATSEKNRYPPVLHEESPLLPGDDDGDDDDVGEITKETTATNNAYEGASIWSQLIFGWLDPLLEHGNFKNQLDPEDLELSPLASEDSTSHVMKVFQEAWDKEQNQKDHRPPSLTRALFVAFGWDFIKAGFLKVINDCLQFVGPQVLNGMVQYIRDPDAPLWHGLGLTATVTLAQIIMSLCLRHYFFILYRVGLRIRTAVVISVYTKSLALGSRHDKSVGQITNLMSVDASRLQSTVVYLHAIWYSFLQIGLALYFLWGQLGPSCLAGVAIILLSIPLTAMVARWMGRLQKRLMKAKDERIEINSEVLSNMKIVKLQAWEEPFQQRIEDLRAAELKRLLIYVLGRACSFLLWSAVPLLVSLSTFAAYVLSGNKLDVASALTALALFDILRFPLFMLPNVINNIVEAGVALERVTSFLSSPEHEPASQGNLSETGVQMVNATFVYDSKRPKDDDDDDDDDTNKKESTEEDDVIIKKLSDAKWELRLAKSQILDAEEQVARLQGREYHTKESTNDLDLLSLRRANFRLREGEFVAVVGAVGSGKSTFLKSILGEVRRLTGELSVKGKLGYFGQDPL
jgi:ABC-type multidrug transport system fused ATPase/permease subunit